MSEEHLQRLQTAALLSPSQEIHLAHLVQNGQKEDATKQQKKAAERARKKFILSNHKLVMHIANKYLRFCKSLEFEDLFAEGIFGLNQAITRFDSSRGYKFSTYAYWWIRQSITRAIVSQDKTIRWPQHVHEKINAFKKNGSASERDLAQIKDAMLTSNVLSLNLHPLDHYDKTSELIDFIGDQKAEEEANEHFMNQLGIDGKQLYLYMKLHLTTKEYQALSMRYGLNQEEPLTLAEIGKRLNLSRERVRQLVLRAERKLRVAFTAANLKS